MLWRKINYNVSLDFVFLLFQSLKGNLKDTRRDVVKHSKRFRNWILYSVSCINIFLNLEKYVYRFYILKHKYWLNIMKATVSENMLLYVAVDCAAFVESTNIKLWRGGVLSAVKNGTLHSWLYNIEKIYTTLAKHFYDTFFSNRKKQIKIIFRI